MRNNLPKLMYGQIVEKDIFFSNGSSDKIDTYYLFILTKQGTLIELEYERYLAFGKYLQPNSCEIRLYVNGNRKPEDVAKSTYKYWAVAVRCSGEKIMRISDFASKVYPVIDPNVSNQLVANEVESKRQWLRQVRLEYIRHIATCCPFDYKPNQLALKEYERKSHQELLSWCEEVAKKYEDFSIPYDREEELAWCEAMNAKHGDSYEGARILAKKFHCSVQEWLTYGDYHPVIDEGFYEPSAPDEKWANLVESRTDRFDWHYHSEPAFAYEFIPYLDMINGIICCNSRSATLYALYHEYESLLFNDVCFRSTNEKEHYDIAAHAAYSNFITINCLAKHLGMRYVANICDFTSVFYYA